MDEEEKNVNRKDCSYKYCAPIEIQARTAELESKPIEIEVSAPTPYVKVQVKG